MEAGVRPNGGVHSRSAPVGRTSSHQTTNKLCLLDVAAFDEVYDSAKLSASPRGTPPPTPPPPWLVGFSCPVRSTFCIILLVLGTKRKRNSDVDRSLGLELRYSPLSNNPRPLSIAASGKRHGQYSKNLQTPRSCQIKMTSQNQAFLLHSTSPGPSIWNPTLSPDVSTWISQTCRR